MLHTVWLHRRSRQRARVLRLFRAARRYVVAAEMEPAGAPRAHAVGDIGRMTAQHGIALCGLPAEELVIVPDLAWQQLEESSRCRLCQEAWLVET